MTTGLRRIFLTALLGLLVGLGALVTLLARRPRQRVAADVAPGQVASASIAPVRVTVQANRPVPVAAPSPAPRPVHRTGSGSRFAIAAGIAGLLLLSGLTGIIVTNRDGLFGPGFHKTDGDRTPLSALSPSNTGHGDAVGGAAETPAAIPPQPAERPETHASAAEPNRTDGGFASDAARPTEDRRSSDVSVTGKVGPASEVASGERPEDAATGSSKESASSQEAQEAIRPDASALTSEIGGSVVAHGGPAVATETTTVEAGTRLILNDPRIAPASVARDGTVMFGSGQDKRPKSDDTVFSAVDAIEGKMRDAAERPASAPRTGRDAVERSAAGMVTSSDRPTDQDTTQQPFSTGSLGRTEPPRSEPGASVADIRGSETTLIAPGDSLWAISRRTYGAGRRYTAIYDANQNLIRDPDRIYPGQILVLPGRAVKRD